MTEARRNLLSGTVLCLFAAAFYWAIAASSQRAGPVRGRAVDVMGDMGFPIALALVIGLGGLAIVVRNLIALYRNAAAADVQPGGSPGAAGNDSSVELRRSLSLAAVVTAYVLLLPTLGYVLAMPLFLVVALVISGYRARMPIVLFTVSFTAVTYFGFAYGLGVRLPTLFLF